MSVQRRVSFLKEGNVVYARSLRRGEVDPGEDIRLEPGDRLVISEGQLEFSTTDIDEYANPKGFGGYRSIASTAWAWSQIRTEPDEYNYLFFALARRLDATHALWVSVVQTLEKARTAEGKTRQNLYINALALAEMTVVALSRCYNMITGPDGLIKTYCPKLKMPDSVARTKCIVKHLRNAYEHIEERAKGRVGFNGEEDQEAKMVFHQPDFVSSSVLRYKGMKLHVESHVIQALLDCRKLMMEAIDERVRQLETQLDV